MNDNIATFPRKSIFAILLRPGFSVVFEDYSGGSEHRTWCQEGKRCSPGADIHYSCACTDLVEFLQQSETARLFRSQPHCQGQDRFESV